jgi:hypothetical protein
MRHFSGVFCFNRRLAMKNIASNTSSTLWDGLYWILVAGCIDEAALVVTLLSLSGNVALHCSQEGISQLNFPAPQGIRYCHARGKRSLRGVPYARSLYKYIESWATSR